MAEMAARILRRTVSLDAFSGRRQQSFGPAGGQSFRGASDLPDDLLAMLAARVMESSASADGSASGGASGSVSGSGREGGLKRRNSSRRGAGIFGSKSVFGSREDEAACRVCMEPVGDDELASGMALRLGCRCMAGLDVLHTECAERWFRIRGSSLCEVCGAEAKNLSEELKAEFRKVSEIRMRQLAARTSVEHLLPRSQSSMSGRPRDGVHAHMMMAGILAFGLFFFYSVYLKLDRVASAFISLIVGYSTTLPYFAGRHADPLTHLAITLWFLASVMGIAALLVKIQGWEPAKAAVFSAFVGGVLSAASVAAVEAAWALRRRWAQRGWTFAPTSLQGYSQPRPTEANGDL